MKQQRWGSIAAIASALAALAVHAPAGASAQLAEQKQCMGCHALKQDGAGPAFEKVGRFWKGRADAEKTLVEVIRRGSDARGAPHWNKARMPDDAERPRVSEAEARQLTRWILSQP